MIHVFRYSAGDGRAAEIGTIPVPPPSCAPVPENFPPKTSGHLAWPDRLAISPNGRTLLVPLNLADAAAIIDTQTHAVRYVPTGAFPYGAAILPDNQTGLVSNEGPGTVSVISLANATKRKDIQVAANLSHPEAIAIDPTRAPGLRGHRQRGSGGGHQHRDDEPREGAVGAAPTGRRGVSGGPDGHARTGGGWWSRRPRPTSWRCSRCPRAR